MTRLERAERKVLKAAELYIHHSDNLSIAPRCFEALKARVVEMIAARERHPTRRTKRKGG